MYRCTAVAMLHKKWVPVVKQVLGFDFDKGWTYFVVAYVDGYLFPARASQVVRSLSACQGALLLVDATQGVQAQTLSTAKAAQAAGLKLVPVVTKIDLHHANVEVSVSCMYVNCCCCSSCLSIP